MVHKYVYEQLKRVLGVQKIQLKPVSAGQSTLTFIVNDDFVMRLKKAGSEGNTLITEASILKSLDGKLRIPKVIYSGSSGLNGIELLVQERMEGSTLAKLWPDSSQAEKAEYITSLAAQLKLLHSVSAESFFSLSAEPPWPVYLKKHILECFSDMETTNVAEAPLEYLKEYYSNNYHYLDSQETMCLVHGDIHFENILAKSGSISALIDFEYASLAPADLELAKLINFVLDPVFYVEERLHLRYFDADLELVFSVFKKAYPSIFMHGEIVKRQKLYLIPDILWGFKKARKKDEGLRALQKFKTVYEGKVLDSLLQN